MAPQVDVQKINHRTQAYPVNQVADRPAGDQAETHGIADGLLAQTPLQHADHNQGRDGDHDKKNLPPPDWSGQQAKCHPGVGQVGQVEKAGDNRPDLEKGKIPNQPQLAGLVENNDQDDQKAEEQESHLNPPGPGRLPRSAGKESDDRRPDRR